MTIIWPKHSHLRKAELTKGVESEWSSERCRSRQCAWRPSEPTCPIRPATDRTQTAGIRRSGACSPQGPTSLPIRTNNHDQPHQLVPDLSMKSIIHCYSQPLVWLLFSTYYHNYTDKQTITNTTITCVAWWLSGRALDLRFTGRRFNSWLVCFHVT